MVESLSPLFHNKPKSIYKIQLHLENICNSMKSIQISYKCMTKLLLGVDKFLGDYIYAKWLIRTERRSNLKLMLNIQINSKYYTVSLIFYSLKD